MPLRIFVSLLAIAFSACSVPFMDKKSVSLDENAVYPSEAPEPIFKGHYKVEGVVLIAELRSDIVQAKEEPDLMHYKMETFLDDGRIFILYFASKMHFGVGDRIALYYKNRKIYGVKKIF